MVGRSSVQREPDYFRRIARANGIKLVARKTKRFHVAANQTHRLDGIRKQRLAGIAREREMFRPDRSDGVVHDLRIDAEQRRKLVECKVEENAEPGKLFHLLRR